MLEPNCEADVRDVTDEFGAPRCHDPRVTLTVLIVDDHAGFRHFARGLLEATGVSVVGEAEDGLSAPHRVVALRPGVGLLDIMLPDLDGFAVADCLAALAEPPTVVLTSSRDPSDFGERLSQSLARGLIRKDHLTGAALERLVAAG